jgi:hypothetical protein
MLTAHDLPVTAPCDVSWAELDGEGRARMCARCDRTVHDLSMLRLSEVAALVAEPGQTCVRYEHRSDGRLVMPVASVESATQSLAAALPGVLRSEGAERVLRLAQLATMIRSAFGG